MRRFIPTLLIAAVFLTGCGFASTEASAPADVQKLVEAICFTKTEEAPFVAEKMEMSLETILGYMSVPLDCTEVRYLGEVKTTDFSKSYVFTFKSSEGYEEWWIFQIDNETGSVLGVD